jgi:hypothetical protein
MSKPCRYFNTQTGCHKGDGCTFLHQQQTDNEDLPELVSDSEDELPTIHPLAEIFTNEVINHPTGYKFNSVCCLAYPWVHDCNLFFPIKYGNGWDEYGRKIPHPDDNKSFFFWRTYDSYDDYDTTHKNPEFLHSWWENYILDGTSKYNYQDEYPIEVLHPDDETPNDRERRYLQYRKNACIWGLLDCHCTSSGSPCMKIENERYGCSYGSRQFVSISTDQSSTLEARMIRNGWNR